MRLAISGGRTLKTWLVAAAVREHFRRFGAGGEILVGDCPTGVDFDVAQFCECELVRFEADWEKHGRAAGPIRNAEIVAACDKLIAFWDGKSRGTQDAIKKARAAGKLLAVVNVEVEMSEKEKRGNS